MRVEHLAHQPERNPGHLDKPEITLVVVAEQFADPEPVDVGQAVQREVDGVRIAAVRVHVVPCVLVYQAAFAVRVENTACPAHRLPVERTVVDVDTVDAHVFDHPVQSFEVVVIPARLGIGDDRDIELTLVFALFEARIPGRNIVLAHVMDEPWSRTVRIDDRSGIVTGPVFDDLVAKAAEHPEFGGFDRQLTAGVIEAYFQVVRMRFRDEGFHIGHVLVYHAVNGLHLADDLLQPPVQVVRIHTLSHADTSRIPNGVWAYYPSETAVCQASAPQRNRRASTYPWSPWPRMVAAQAARM